MKHPPALSLMAIRALSQDLVSRVSAISGDKSWKQPGRKFFPKYTHELGVADGESPSGLSVDYIISAARLNGRVVHIATGDLLTVLMRAVEFEITRARILEARLIETMDRGS